MGAPIRVELAVEIDIHGDTVDAVAVLEVEGEYVSSTRLDPPEYPEVTLMEVRGNDGRLLTVPWAVEQSLRQQALELFEEEK